MWSGDQFMRAAHAPHLRACASDALRSPTSTKPFRAPCRAAASAAGMRAAHAPPLRFGIFGAAPVSDIDRALQGALPRGGFSRRDAGGACAAPADRAWRSCHIVTAPAGPYILKVLPQRDP